jgi:hypothetical protein
MFGVILKLLILSWTKILSFHIYAPLRIIYGYQQGIVKKTGSNLFGIKNLA